MVSEGFRSYTGGIGRSYRGYIQRRKTMKRIFGTVATLTATLVLAAQTTFAAPLIGNPAFQRVWNRQDLPIALHLTGRSWTWGPEPISDAVREPFAEGVE